MLACLSSAASEIDWRSRSPSTRPSLRMKNLEGGVGGATRLGTSTRLTPLTQPVGNLVHSSLTSWPGSWCSCEAACRIALQGKPSLVSQPPTAPPHIMARQLAVSVPDSSVRASCSLQGRQARGACGCAVMSANAVLSSWAALWRQHQSPVLAAEAVRAGRTQDAQRCHAGANKSQSCLGASGLLASFGPLKTTHTLVPQVQRRLLRLVLG